MKMAEIKMYSTQSCSWCFRAKRLLADQGYTDITEIDVEGWGPDRDKLESITGERSVPQIYVGEVHVGGFNELARLVRDDKLAGLVNA